MQRTHGTTTDIVLSQSICVEVSHARSIPVMADSFWVVPVNLWHEYIVITLMSALWIGSYRYVPQSQNDCK